MRVLFPLPVLRQTLIPLEGAHRGPGARAVDASHWMPVCRSVTLAELQELCQLAAQAEKFGMLWELAKGLEALLRGYCHRSL